MGYETEISGELKFLNDLTGSQLFYLQNVIDGNYLIMGGSNYQTMKKACEGFIILPDFSGIMWNGSLRVGRDVEFGVRYIISTMHLANHTAFGLVGTLHGVGSGFTDTWRLTVDHDSVVNITNVVIEGTIQYCPNCDERYINNQADNVMYIVSGVNYNEYMVDSYWMNKDQATNRAAELRNSPVVGNWTVTPTNINSVLSTQKVYYGSK